MAGTPLFLITNVGLNAANHANPQGPFIHIIYFQVGSAYGYQPQTTDTSLNGTVLYQAAPSSYANIGNNTINIICQIPPEAGPFDFGEIGIFADDGTGTGYLFAKAVFDTPQTKFSSLGTNVVSSYTLNCLLKLQQSTAIFQIDTNTGPPAVVEIFQWSDVFPPGVSANPDVPMYNVRELSTYGDSTLLANATDANWSVESTYERYTSTVPNSAGKFTVANSSTSWVQIAASAMHPADVGIANRGMILQTPDGFFRSVSSIAVSGSNYQLNLNVTNDGTYNNTPLLTAPAVGSQVTLYRIDRAGGAVYYSQIVDPPSIPLAENGVPGLAYGSTGTYMPAPGIIQAYGLLQAPSTNTGRILTSSDNLNYTSWPSGWYTVSGATAGFPANLPITIDGHLMIMSENALAQQQGTNAINTTQIFYPAGNGGGDANGVGGYPPYWREWNNSVSNGQGGWSNWFAMSVQGKNSQSNGSALQDSNPTGGTSQNLQVQVPIAGAGTWNVLGWGKGMVNTYTGAQLLINGVLVDTTGAYGDTAGIGFNTMWGTQKITVSGPTTIQIAMVTNSISGALGDFRVLGMAIPTNP